MKFYSIFEFEV